MQGLFKRKASDVWHGRFRIPENIWRERGRLRELGVRDIGKSQEFARSTGHRDRDKAGEAYRAELTVWDLKLGAWQTLLNSGPEALTHKQQVALAGEYAKAFLTAHEDEPDAAPPRQALPEPPQDDNGAMRAMADAMSPSERETFAADLRAFLTADEGEKIALAFRLLVAYPGLKAVIGPDLASGLETMHGADADDALAAHGLHVDATSRRLLNFQMLAMMGAARRGLEARQGGDYGAVAELEAVPAFVPPTENGAPAILTLEYLLDHKASTQDIKAKTIKGDRVYLRKFAAFVGHDDARTVTKDHVRRWRDHLIAGEALSPKTVNDKYLSAVRSVLSHGVKEFDLPANVATGLRDHRAAPAPNGSKGYSEEQALKVLNASFAGTSKALSAPHRRALFWVPWMLAYTGLRVTEVTQLRARHLMEEDGVPYLLITPADGSTKSGKAWAVGIHQHLIELGLLEFIQGFGDGPMFYEPYPTSTDLTAIKGQPRSMEAGKRLAKWISAEIGIKAPLGRPNHAWRHLFTTRSRACGMDKEARDFMLGSRSETDAREGYGDWPPVVLDREINKLPRFEVKDTGWRPSG